MPKNTTKNLIPSGPFFIVLVDDDNGTFNVTGPLSDDTALNARVCRAQAEGKNVRCFSSHDDVKKDDLIADVKVELGRRYEPNFFI